MGATERTSTGKNAAYQIIYQILVTITPLITTPIVSRELGAENIGIYQFTLSIQSYFVLFAMLGFTDYGTRTIAETPRDKNELSAKFWSIYILQICSSAIAIIAYLTYATTIAETRVIALLQGIWVLSSLFNINWFFFGIEQFKLTITRNLLIKIITVLCIVLFVRKGNNPLIVYICIMTMGDLCSNAVLIPLLSKYVVLSRPKWVEIKKHIKPVFVLFIPLLAFSVFETMDKTMLGKIGTYKELGYYTNSSKLFNIPLGIITGLESVFLPRSAILFSESRDKGFGFLTKSFEIICFFTFAITFGIAGCKEKFIPLFFGEGYERCITLTYYFVPVVIVQAISSFFRTQYLIPNHKDRLYVIATFMGAVVNIVLNAVLIPPYGAAGAVISTLIAGTIVCGLQFYGTEKDTPLAEWIRTAAVYCVIGLVMLAVMSRLSFDTLNNLCNVVIQVVTGGTIYIVLVFLYWTLTGKRRWAVEMAKSVLKK